VDAFEDAIRAQLELVPTMPATVIAERVGWTRGITVFKERVAELRPAYLPGPRILVPCRQRTRALDRLRQGP
jgi:hypothetical protein